MPASEQDIQQIAVVIEQYRRGFATLDIDALKTIWAQDYHQIIYIAQEMAQPLWGWEAVEHYYERIGRLIERVTTMTVSDISVDVLNDVAFAFLSFHFEGEIKGRPHIADGRVTFLLRKSETWKVIHYHESRLGDYLGDE